MSFDGLRLRRFEPSSPVLPLVSIHERADQQGNNIFNKHLTVSWIIVS
jgi:hypothetical protein